MRKVYFTMPHPIEPNRWDSRDPADYTADRVQGWIIELEPEDIILFKNARGMWQIADPLTGRVLSTRHFKTRKDAASVVREYSGKLRDFKQNKLTRDTYRELADLCEALAHELQVLENARADNGFLG